MINEIFRNGEMGMATLQQGKYTAHSVNTILMP